MSSLLKSAGSVVTRDLLAKEVLERPLGPFDRNIDVHVSPSQKKSREKIERLRTYKNLCGGLGYVYTFPDPTGGVNITVYMIIIVNYILRQWTQRAEQILR